MHVHLSPHCPRALQRLQDEIGDALAESISEGIVTRDQVFVSSKLNNPYHRPEWVRPALEKTLLDLKIDCLGARGRAGQGRVAAAL